jgi:hypothetical protein
MNKNHLLPALLFVLAACGPATSSSAPASSSAQGPVDNNEYRFVGSQANIGSWTPGNAPVMTRATGTNSFSWTGDLYVDSTWKLVIGTEWTNGEVGPMSAGLSVIDKGVTWTKNADGALVIPADSNSGFDPGLGGVGNFKTLVHGNYTVTFVSLPALTRTFTIVRNGEPTVAPVSITDWALAGTFNGWTATNMNFKLTNENDENENYELFLNLFKDEEFKFVKNGAWGGDLGFAALVTPNAADLVDAGGNIKVVRDGSFRVRLTVATATTASIVRIGAASQVSGGLKLVGSIQTPAWTPSNNSFPLTFDGGMYYGRFELPLNAEVKVKNGATWDEGFDAGFSKVTSMPTGAFADAGGNIKALVAGNYRFAVRVAGKSLIIKLMTDMGSNIINSFATNGGMSAEEKDTGAQINYTNTPTEWWNNNAQLKFVNSDGTKTELKVNVIGVAGTTYLFKFEKTGGANAAGTFAETEFVGTGAAQTVTVSLSALTVAQRAELNLFVVFVVTGTGKTPASLITGAVTISRVYYASFLTYGAMTAIETSTGATQINYTNTPTDWWGNNAQLNLVRADNTKPLLNVDVTGVAGTTYLFKFEKPNGQFVETEFVGTGAAQTVTLSLSALTVAQRAEMNLFVVFVKTPTTTGAITISRIYYASFLTYGSMNAIETSAGTRIDYTNTPTEWWNNNAQLKFVYADGTKTELKVDVVGVAGTTYLFKFEKQGGANVAGTFAETEFVGTGAAQTVTVSLSGLTVAQRAEMNLCVVFVKTATATGSITVSRIYYA